MSVDNLSLSSFKSLVNQIHNWGGEILLEVSVDGIINIESDGAQLVELGGCLKVHIPDLICLCKHGRWAFPSKISSQGNDIEEIEVKHELDLVEVQHC